MRERGVLNFLLILSVALVASAATALAQPGKEDDDYYQSKWNTRLSKNCLKLFNKRKATKYTWPQIKTGFERLMKESHTRVMDCRVRYPELSGYIDEWEHQMLQGVVECEDTPASKVDYAAYSDHDGWRPSAVFPIDIVEHFAQAKDDSFEGNFKWENIVDDFIHEFFHHTSANNLRSTAHGDAERLAPGKIGKCGNDVTTDRVSVISSLCSGTHLNSSKDPAPLVFLDRMKECPGSCEKLFMAKFDRRFLDFFDGNALTSKALSSRDASNICQRIRDDGNCAVVRRDNRDVLLASDPVLKAVGAKLKARFTAQLPHHAYEIPDALLDVFPEIKAGREAIGAGRCFNALFKPYDRGGGDKGMRFLHPPSWLDNQDLDLAYYRRSISSFVYSDMQDFIKSAQQIEPACEKETDRGGPRAWAGGLYERMRALEKNDGPTYDMALALAEGKSFSYPFCEKCTEVKRTPEFLAFFGRELFDEFLDAVKKHHPDSPTYSCEAAGLSPFRAAETARRIASLASSGQTKPSTCP
jgi:hypothetical protein